MDREPVEREEYEHVPWSELIDEVRPDRSRMVLTAGAIVLAAAAGLFGARLLAAPDSAPIAAVEASASTTVDAVPATAAASASTVRASTSVAPPALFTEADLMAVLPEQEMRAAAVRAEWYVRDFFTRDRSGDQDLVAPFSMNVDGPAADVTTYVEWAAALRVASPQPGEYEVTVAFRLLAENDQGTFSRQPVRTVGIAITTTANGVPAVADVPAPVDFDLAGEATRPIVENPPEDVAAEALALASGHGSEPVVLEASRTPTGWRVIVAVTDATGVRWPLRFDVG